MASGGSTHSRVTTIGAVMHHAYDDFVLTEPEVLAVFDDLRLGVEIPLCPLLVIQATHDQIIDVRDVDSLVVRYADGGADVMYVRDRLSEHITLMILGMPTKLAWLDKRFAGVDAPVTTRTRIVTSLALSPRAWPGFARMLGAAAKTAVGRAGYAPITVTQGPENPHAAQRRCGRSSRPDQHPLSVQL